MTAAAGLSPALITFGPPILTLAFGFLVGRWTMSKKERKDFEQKNFENTRELIAKHDTAYAAYTAALNAYNQGATPSLGAFVDIATTGDHYFYQLNLMCAAILSDKIDGQTRDNVLLAKIRGVIDRNLEPHYTILRDISENHGFVYGGELRREDYAAIYAVIEKFGDTPSWNVFN